MFSDQFREKLGTYKYARWAKDLTEDQLEAVLWAVGEYGMRAHGPLDAIRQSPKAVHPRAKLALEVLACFTSGTRIDLERLFERIQALNRPPPAVPDTTPPT
jgi:hypothetical protein